MVNIHTLESDTLNANAVKETVLEKLISEKILTKEVAEEFADKWQVIIVPPSWFKRWANKFGITDNDSRYKIVKFED
jgi:hypothetical protein